MIYTNETKYLGAFVENQRHGTGMMEWPGGARYMGEW